MFGSSIGVGDWVRARHRIAVSFTDHLTGGGISEGTAGVVTSTSGWGRVTVDFDTGWGVCTTTVGSGSVRRTRRDGGVEQFRRRVHTVTLVRIGLALVMLGPVLYFVGWYLFTYRTFTGIFPAFLETALESAIDLVGSALNHPVQTAIYLLVTSLIGRWTFHR